MIGSDREDGAILVIAAFVTVLLIGSAAFAVDAGSLWSSQRRLRTSTDAAALAAAQSYAEGVDGCAGIADTYATANDPDATVTDCHDHPNGDAGYVTVAAEETVDLQFAGIFGLDTSDVTSTTHAMYGFPTGGAGMRPMGLCAEAHADLIAWLNLPEGPTGDSGPIRIDYSKDHPDACGEDAPGNWGMLDFDGGNNSAADMQDWVSNGYPETVPLSPPSIPGDPGAFSPTIDSELGTMLNKQFALPIFDNVSDDSGGNVTFDVVAFVWVKLVGYEVNGPQADRYLELEFQAHEVIQGTCCGTTGGLDTGVRAVRICATDPGHDDACVSGSG